MFDFEVLATINVMADDTSSTSYGCPDEKLY